MPLSIYVFREIRRIVRHVSISSLNGNVCVFLYITLWSTEYFAQEISIKISPVIVSFFEMDTVKVIYYLWGKWNSTSTFRMYFLIWSQIRVRYQHIIRMNVYFVKIGAGMAVHFIWAKIPFIWIYRETLWSLTSKVHFRKVCVVCHELRLFLSF